jgi:hypothetical protein
MIEFVIHVGLDMKLNSKKCFDVANGNIKAIKVQQFQDQFLVEVWRGNSH